MTANTKSHAFDIGEKESEGKMTPMTPEQLAEIKERCEAATPGEVKLGPSAEVMRGRHARDIVLFGFGEGERLSTQKFIATARDDIPALLAHIEHQDGVIERISEERDRAKRGIK